MAASSSGIGEGIWQGVSRIWADWCWGISPAVDIGSPPYVVRHKAMPPADRCNMIITPFLIKSVLPKFSQVSPTPVR